MMKPFVRGNLHVCSREHSHLHRGRKRITRLLGATLMPAIVCLTLLSCDKKQVTGTSAPGDSRIDPELPEIIKTPLAPQQGKAAGKTLFVAVPPEQSGISPVVKYKADQRFANFQDSGMEAGGVATGDLDGDGLPDLFLASAPGNNRIYRQVSPLRFVDITEGSGIDQDNSWSRGASMVDIDNDGDLDIYVTNYADPNCLYINQGKDGNGNLRFVESAKAFGLARAEASLMPAFCDYDSDGDLDMYLVTNQFHWPDNSKPPDEGKMIGKKNGKPVLNSPYDLYFRIVAYRKTSTGKFQVKWNASGRPDFLFRNNGNGTFSEVTEEAGIAYDPGRGLSATWWDYNDDGHQDLYVANDWADRDFLYLNNGDGTFRDVIEDAVPHTPMYSMGSDIGDLNNDGKIDFIAADMSGTTHYKRKISMGAMTASQSNFMAAARPPQNMRNVVYLNTGTNRLMESAYLMNLASSDWSWTVRIADLDNDGYSDVFITNGMEKNIRQLESGVNSSSPDLLNEKNLALRNEGDFRFVRVGAKWGLDHFGSSLAAAACDFDRDGDIDIFVIHRGEQPVLYRNTCQESGILVRLRGRASNRFGIGAKIRAETSAGHLVRQITSARGYLSSDEAVAHFGLGQDTTVARLIVEWPNGNRQEFADLPAGHSYLITEPKENHSSPAPPQPGPEPLFSASGKLSGVLHTERTFDDFALQPLLPNKMSQLGPGLATGDLDNDGDEDFILGGAAGSPTQIITSLGGGNFAPPLPIAGSEVFEDMGLLLLDVDGDGDRDLYAVSGGIETSGKDLRDRLYLNDGSGKFKLAPDGSLPLLEDSGGSIAAADIDRDGDLDLFVGGRVIPGKYPAAADSRVLLNSGGRFTDATQTIAPSLLQLGLVTGAVFADVNNDGWQDLLIALEWGPVTCLYNKAGKFTDATAEAGLAGHTGWWNGITAGDIDLDGDIDFVAANFGLNTKYHASPGHPALLYSGNFGTDTTRLIEAEFEGDQLFPVRGKSCSTRAIPHLAQKFQTFHSFALAELDQIYTPPELKGATEFSATTLASGVFINNGKGKFDFRELPRLAQVAPSFGTVISDLDGDGIPDLYLAQNFYGPQVETGRMSGGLSVLLRGLGDGNFEPLWPRESGLIVAEDATAACLADVNGDNWPDLLVASNNGPLRCFINRGSTRYPKRRMRRVTLRAKTGNMNAAGARVTAMLSDGTRQTAAVVCGSGYLAQSTQSLFFGLGERQLTELSILWPDGMSTSHRVSGKQGSITISQPAVAPSP
ncbi:MAG: FG-GAP-like repeat-containing protein [Verrucomicrobiales bacterium]